MAKKGGNQPQETTSTVTQSSLPPYAQPYYERLMSDAEAESNQGYVPYGGPRIADFNQNQQNAFTGYQNLANYGAPALDQGLNAVGQSNQMIGGADLGNYNPQNVGTGQWDNQTAAQYLNPFVSNVLDNQREAAFKRYNEGQAGRDQQAISAGAFGGSRQGINNYMAERDMQSELSSQEAQAYRDAYQSGLGAYQTDAARQLQAGMANQTTGLNAAQLNQQGVLAGAGQLAQNSGIYGQLGSTQQALSMERLKALQDSGTAQQDQSQRSLDLAYQDFINQRDYQRQNLNWLSGLMHGVPVSAQSDVIQYQAPPNPLSQSLGLGIAGSALSGLTGNG